MKVWVVTIDYGLSGSEVLAIFDEAPSDERMMTLLTQRFERGVMGPEHDDDLFHVAGTNGVVVEPHEVVAP